MGLRLCVFVRGVDYGLQILCLVVLCLGGFRVVCCWFAVCFGLFGWLWFGVWSLGLRVVLVCWINVNSVGFDYA